jgi:hypothetical protein
MSHFSDLRSSETRKLAGALNAEFRRIHTCAAMERNWLFVGSLAIWIEFDRDYLGGYGICGGVDPLFDRRDRGFREDGISAKY